MKLLQWIVFLPLVVYGVFALLKEPARQSGEFPAVEQDVEPSVFLRFKEDSEKPGGGKLETAVIRYERPNGAYVDLIGAVHVGDPAYYDDLEVRFESYESLLYEMIRDKEDDLDMKRADSTLSMFQRFLTDVLELEFQLDGIDYRKSNFVHADMDPTSFFEAQAERGESIATLMMRSMFAQMKRQAEGKGSTLNEMSLMLAFMSDDSARSLKYLFAREFDEIEELMAGIEGDNPEGSVILTTRNKVAIKVLEDELAKGRRSLGIFYGAAHMQDMEERVRALGFKKTKSEYVTAWTIEAKAKRAPAEVNNFHLPWFSDRKKK